LEALAVAAISLVAPYLAKGAESFAEEAGSRAVGVVRALADRLQLWWSHEPVAAAAVEHLADDPKQYAIVLGNLLSARLAEDAAFASDLQRLVDDVAPQVTVVQRVEVAKGVTGVDIEEAVRGDFSVHQEVKHADEVVGLKAKRVGG
jgi:hypothetical protein